MRIETPNMRMLKIGGAGKLWIKFKIKFKKMFTCKYSI